MVGVEAILSFSCCLCCPAWKLKPCFSVSATEQQQNQYSKHCKRNTPSADVHGIFPKCYFFFLFGLILILSSPLLLPNPFPSAACATLFQLMFWLRSVCVPVLLWGLITASQALGWGCWAELWLDVGIAACLDFPVCHSCIVLCVPFNCSCWLWGGCFWRRECQAPSTLQHSGNGGWTSGHQRGKRRQRVFRRILCWPIWPAQLSGWSPAAHWLAGLALSVWPVCKLCSASTVPVPSPLNGTAWVCGLPQYPWNQAAGQRVAEADGRVCSTAQHCPWCPCWATQQQQQWEEMVQDPEVLSW